MTHSRFENEWIGDEAAADLRPQPRQRTAVHARRRGHARWRERTSAIAGVIAGAMMACSAFATYSWLRPETAALETETAIGEEPRRGLQWSQLLARSVLATLDDANRTGNYTVVRDLSAPSFQKANPPERLAAIFSELRLKKVDLSMALRGVPQWTEPPHVDASGILRLRGNFSDGGTVADFALAFLNVAGEWRLGEITVATRQRIE